MTDEELMGELRDLAELADPPPDLTRTQVYMRAGALCIAAEPHPEITDWPCRKHVEEAARQLNVPVPAPALASVTGPTAGALVSGAADRDRRSVSAPPSVEDNRCPAVNEAPAEGGPARPQKQV